MKFISVVGMLDACTVSHTQLIQIILLLKIIDTSYDSYSCCLLLLLLLLSSSSSSAAAAAATTEASYYLSTNFACDKFIGRNLSFASSCL
jgi:hypothetical protein